MKGVVVTGATSMLGIALIEECLCRETDVLAIVRRNSSKKDLLPVSEKLRIIECDLSELAQLPEIKNRYDTFYHFAWQGTDRNGRNNPDIQLQNVQYTIDAISAAVKLGCATFVGAGSQAEYGRVSSKISPKTPVNPDIAYGVAKYAACKMSRIRAEEAGIRHVWARVFSVYGPNDGTHTMIMSGIAQLLKGECPKYTPGEQLWDYLYCGDAAKAFYLMGDTLKSQTVYCLGSGQTRPLHEYIRIMRDAVDPSLEIHFGEIDYPKNQVMYLCADIENLTKDTGFIPETAFEDGIKKTINWYKRSKES